MKTFFDKITQKDIDRLISHIITPNWRYKDINNDWVYNYSMCWETDLAKDKDGYSYFSLNGFTIKAHRFALTINLNRDIKDNYLACHICNNPGCVNPHLGHLYEGTSQDNINDMILSGNQCIVNNHWNAKLNEKIIFNLLDKIYNNEFKSILEVSNFFNIPHTNILDILEGKSWKHITKNYNKDISKLRQKFNNNKLSINNIKNIKNDIILYPNLSNVELAKKYKTSHTTIREIRLGKRHKDI
jgi:hypothetical protein